jgi:hypothetical protein
MDEQEHIAQLSHRVHELEAQYRELEFSHASLAQEVMKTVLAMAEENDICYTALCEILELQTGTVQIAEDAILRILDLRQSLNS